MNHPTIENKGRRRVESDRSVNLFPDEPSSHLRIEGSFNTSATTDHSPGTSVAVGNRDVDQSSAAMSGDVDQLRDTVAALVEGLRSIREKTQAPGTLRNIQSALASELGERWIEEAQK